MSSEQEHEVSEEESKTVSIAVQQGQRRRVMKGMTYNIDEKHGYMYLVRTREFKSLNRPIYKVGMTSQCPDTRITRLHKYTKGSEIYLVLQCHVLDVKLIEKPSIALLIGENISSLNTGEIWHFLENELSLPVTLIQESDLTYSSLDEYTTIFVPEGSYNQSANLTEWISNGGKVIAFGDSYEKIGGAIGLNQISKEEREEEITEETKNSKKKKKTNEEVVAFSDAERNELSNNVIGAIYACKLDKTHPINFGIENYYTLRMGSTSWNHLENGFSPVTILDAKDHVNGFVGHKAAPLQAKSLVVGIQEQGQGKVILFIDNPLFRGFWENGKPSTTKQEKKKVL
jgi:hypothetical protein